MNGHPVSDETASAVLAEYAKDRYESSRQTLIEFPSWARQLAVKIAAATGFELTAAGIYVAFVARLSLSSLAWFVWVLTGLWLVLLFVLVLYQQWLYSWAVRVGYEIQSFEHPRPVADVIAQYESARAGATAEGEELRPTVPSELVTSEYEMAQELRREAHRAIALEIGAIRAAFTNSLYAGTGVTFLAFVILLIVIANPTGAARTAPPTVPEVGRQADVPAPVASTPASSPQPTPSTPRSSIPSSARPRPRTEPTMSN